MSEIPDLKIIASRASEKGELLLSEFRKHLANTNAEHAFVSYAVYLVGQWAQKWDEAGWCDPDPALIELAAFLLFPHFCNTQRRDPDAIQALIDLFEPIRVNRTTETMFDTRAEADGALGDIAVHMRLRRDGVRGSAYPDQTRAEIENIQGPFEDWFRSTIGIGIRRALELVDAIHEQMTRNEDETRKAVLKRIGAKPASPPVSMDDEQVDIEPADLAAWKNRFACMFSVAFSDKLPVSRDQLNWMPQPPTTEEWAALIELVGLISGRCSKLAEPCLVKSRPIYVLPGDRLLLFDWSCVFDELFAAADRVANWICSPALLQRLCM